MATSDSPLNVPNITLAVARPAGGGSEPSEPTGAPSISSVTDNGDGTLSIAGSNFGSKAQATAKLVDYVDHAYENGALNDYHSTFTDGQVVSNAQNDPNEIWYKSYSSDVYGANSNLLSRVDLRHPGAAAHYRCRGDDCGFGGPMAAGGTSPTTPSTKMYLAWQLRRKYTDMQFHAVFDDLSGEFIVDEPITIDGQAGRYIGSHVRSSDGKTAHSFELDGGPRNYGNYYGTPVVGIDSGATATFPLTWNSTNSPDSYVISGPGTKLTRLRDNSNDQHLRSSHSFTDFFAYTVPGEYERTYHSPPQVANEWRLIEEIIDIDPETGTGKHIVRVDGKAWNTGTNPEFASFDATGRDETKAPYPDWLGNNAYEFLQQSDIDEIHYDITLQRVYLGNASTFDACTKFEIQRSLAWAETDIDVEKHEGALAGQPQWVYVAGPDGSINQNGVGA